MPSKQPEAPDSADGEASEKSGDVETEWTLTCLDCDFSMQIDAEGHPRDGPPDVVRNRVTTHKHTTDESHVVRVAGRRADRDRDGTIDPSLVTDGGSEYCAECHRSVAREDRVERGEEVYHRQCAPDDAAENRRLDNPAWKDRLRPDGGLDAETVLNTVDPGDVVEVAGSPYRVVDVDAEDGEGVLRLYDLVERTETIKAAGAGDVSMYLHRSEGEAIRHRVDQERERRDVQEDDVDEEAEA